MDPNVPHRSANDPFNSHRLDYEWNKLKPIDQKILGPHQVTAWELRRADVEARTDGNTSDQERTWSSSLQSTEKVPSSGNTTMQRSRHEYTPTETGSYMPPIQVYDSPIYEPEPLRSSTFSSTISYDWHDFRETTPSWTAPSTNPFETFQHDEETFRRGFQPSQNASAALHARFLLK